MTKVKKIKKTPISKDLKDFLDENLALEIVFQDPKNPEEIITVKNVPVLVHMDSEIIMMYPDTTIRIIPWTMLREIIYPFSEKLFRYAMIGSRAMEKGLEMAVQRDKKADEKVDDGRGFQ